MKTVTLFRHAKSGDKDNPNIEDFDRPLSSRGLKAAPKMGAAMRDRKLKPDLILSSPSVRTRQTLSLAAPEAWDAPPEVSFEERLYDATPQTLFRALRELPDDVTHVMIVGHNPGLQELAVALALPGSQAREEFKAKLPTASVVSFDFDTQHWAKLKPGTGELRLSISPNMLGS
ncbi:MAG: histidine phosphatase family protein [Rhodomicrobium sp.]